jgi:hypothetical protein
MKTKTDYLLVFAVVGLLVMLVTLLYLAVVHAQDAYVIRLDDADALNVKNKWEALQQAQKEWNDERKAIRKKYLIGKSGRLAAKDGMVREGFEGGFTFSKDFFYIVPGFSGDSGILSPIMPCVSHGSWTDCGGGGSPNLINPPVYAPWPSNPCLVMEGSNCQYGTEKP